MDNGFMTLCVGKIGNIFNFAGVTKSIHTISDKNGMDITTDILKKNDFTGLCFVNLVEFDSEYGHRRNVIGYGKHIEEFDEQFKVFMSNMKDDDLVIITADHGNDPTWVGTDHTRERVPFLAYSPSIKNGRKLEERATFADLGATILDNFGIKPSENEIGTAIVEVLE